MRLKVDKHLKVGAGTPRVTLADLWLRSVAFSAGTDSIAIGSSARSGGSVAIGSISFDGVSDFLPLRWSNETKGR